MKMAAAPKRLKQVFHISTFLFIQLKITTYKGELMKTQLEAQ